MRTGKFFVKDSDIGADPVVHMHRKRIKGSRVLTDLFSALSAALFHTLRGAPTLKKVCCRFLSDNWPSYLRYFDPSALINKQQYCDSINEGTIEPGRAEIAVTADLFKCNIDFIDSSNNSEHFNGGNGDHVILRQFQSENGFKYVSHLKTPAAPYSVLDVTNCSPTVQDQQERHQPTLRRGLVAPHMLGKAPVSPEIPVYSVSNITGSPSPSPPASPTRRRRIHSRTCHFKSHLLPITYSSLQLSDRSRHLVLFHCYINRKRALALFDPGSEFTLAKPNFISPDAALQRPAKLPGLADSSPLPVSGMCKVLFELGPISADYTVYVSPAIGYDIILGTDWMEYFLCSACFPCRKFMIEHGDHKILLSDASPYGAHVNALNDLGKQVVLTEIFTAHRNVQAQETIVIEPGQTRMVSATVSPVPLPQDSAALFTPSVNLIEGLQAVECVIGHECDKIPVTNHSDIPLVVEVGSTLGRIEENDADVPTTKIDKIAFKNADGAPSPPPQPSVNTITTPKFDVNPALPKDTQEQFLNLLNEFQDIFHKKGEPLRCTNILEVKLELHDNTLYYVPQYRLTPEQIEAANEEVESLLKQRTIKEQNSHFCLSLLVVPRATPPGEKQRWRCVLDARPLNRRLKTINFKGTPSHYYLNYLRNKKIFSQFDLKSSYQQIKIHPDSQQYLAFQHQGKSYVYTSMPFGVACAGELLQMALHHALSGLLFNGVVFYVDDGTCATNTFEEHLLVLRSVFERFRKHVLVLNLDKCRFGYFDAVALGMVVTQNSLKPDLSRVRPLQHLLDVQSKKRAKGVVAYFQFFRNFIKAFARRAHILYEAAHPQTKFTWTDQHKAVVEELYQDIITSALRHYHEDHMTRLLCDGSREGIGAIMMQLDPSTQRWHPVGNHSRKLTKTELGYSMSSIELLAISDACTHFNCELQSLRDVCEVHTDCQALIYLFTADFLPPPMARLMTHIRMYNLRLKHVPGNSHLAADALSRNPLPHNISDFDVRPLPGEDVDTDNRQHATAQPTVAAVITRAQAATARNKQQSADSSGSPPHPTLPAPPKAEDSDSDRESAEEEEEEEEDDGDGGAGYISPSDESDEEESTPCNWTVKADTSEYEKQQHFDPDIRPIIDHLSSPKPSKFKNFQIFNSLLYKVSDGKLRLYVPASLQQDVLTEFHNFGHFGAQKTTAKISEFFYWPGLAKSCTDFTNRCLTCQQFKRKPTLEGFLQSIDPKGPNEMVFIDFKAAPTSSRGNSQILVCVDGFTRFVRLFPTKSCTTQNAVSALRKAFTETGTPGTLVCDEGSAFTSKEFRKFIKEVNCNLHVIPANAHQANGLAESFAKTTGERVALMCSNMLSSWDRMLPQIQLAINDSKSRALGNTPFFLLHGYHPRFSKLQPFIPRHVSKSSADHLETLWNARISSMEALKRSQKAQALRYNANRREPRYTNGQRVWIYYRQRSKLNRPEKYASAWRPGRIIEQLNPVTYLVKTQQAGKPVVKKVHVNFLKKRLV